MAVHHSMTIRAFINVGVPDCNARIRTLRSAGRMMATFGPAAAVSIDVAAGSTTMVALVEPTVSAKVHEKLRLAINPDRVHFFDNETEAAI